MEILNQKEIEAIITLPSQERYVHFLKQIADWGAVWGLFNSGWVTLKDKEGNELLPIWPHKDCAELFLKEKCLTAVPKEIDVYDFTEDFLPKLEKNNIAILVFPTPKTEGSIICYSQLYQDLNEELSKY